MREIKQLLEITQQLRDQYKRGFPLDGRLVGDIGEVLAAEKYGLDLSSGTAAGYEGFVIGPGRNVQVQAWCG